MKILITGSEGLIGTHLAAALGDAGNEVEAFDLRLADASGRALDARNRDQLETAIAGCDGIVHLAAVSRVIWGERDPELCRAVNVAGTRNLCAVAQASDARPFVIFGSSREVYGLSADLPVAEDAELNPCNIYGETKVEGERLIRALSDAGLATSVLRFSNVYGWTGDHSDRVIPAFAREAARGGAIHVDGADCVFDFTHVNDVAPAIARAAEALTAGRSLPDIHLVSGAGTTLGELARLAGRLSQGRLEVTELPPRDFDVARFVGDPARARELLGWAPGTDLATGFGKLVEDFRQQDGASAGEAAARSSGRARP